jgi:hypothetical protein
MPQDMAPATEPAEASNLGTPLRALRQHCVECCGGNFAEVRACSAQSCPLWLFRHGRNPTAAERAAVAGQPVHPLERTLAGASGLKAIRRRCLDCSGNSEPAVRSCAHTGCSLHGFRRGKNPNIKRDPEVTRAAGRRLALANAASLSKHPVKNPHSEPAQDLAGVMPPKTIVAAE